MLGVSGHMGTSGDGAAAEESGGASGGSSEIPGGAVEESERSGGGAGNRWPRQETLALLKIRSDMDVAFRDSSLKGPLWEEVSRKMSEHGFQRNAKKCKEKFENVYKYHKRTKDGRASKPDGKTYRFFDQIEALENTTPLSFTSPQPPAAAAMAAPPLHTNFPMPSPHSTVSSISPNPISILPPNTTIQTGNNHPFLSTSPFQQLHPPPNTSNHPQTHNFQPFNPHLSTGILSNSSSSSTSSDEDIQRRRGRKRKWKDFFQRAMKEVIQKQEELQKKFLDTLEKRDRDRTSRDEAWRAQETARMNREHELLAQERSIAAVKDAAVMTFLQKITQQHNLQIPIVTNNAPPQVPIPAPVTENSQPPYQPPPPQPEKVTLAPLPPVQPQPQLQIVAVTPMKMPKTDNGGGEISAPASSSRWPQSEVEALIKLRTNLDLKYQENVPKGPLWEEISASMARLGYNRSSKRCKEKWENINKYYKKVKESSKKRPEDSKTCPYFQQLEAIYKDRVNKNDSFNPGYMIMPKNPMAAIMARPEQQWPVSEQQKHQDSAMHDKENENESENSDQEDEDEDGAGYEIVTNKQQSSVTNTVE